MDAFARLAQPWIDRAARIGADPRDDDEARLRKALLVLVCVLILPISLVWGAIYLALGATAGLVAWLFLLISVAAIAIFSRTRDTETFFRIELLDILLAPTISMAFWAASPAQAPWACGASWRRSGPSCSTARAPACAGLSHSSPSSWCPASSVRWPAAGRPSGLVRAHDVALNVTFAGTVVFRLLALFVRQRKEALAALRIEQDRPRACS